MGGYGAGSRVSGASRRLIAVLARSKGRRPPRHRLPAPTGWRFGKARVAGSRTFGGVRDETRSSQGSPPSRGQAMARRRPRAATKATLPGLCFVSFCATRNGQPLRNPFQAPERRPSACALLHPLDLGSRGAAIWGWNPSICPGQIRKTSKLGIQPDQIAGPGGGPAMRGGACSASSRASIGPPFSLRPGPHCPQSPFRVDLRHPL